MTPREFPGLGVSSGISIGRAHLLHAEALPVAPNPVPPERIDDEIERFNRAREAARGELRELEGEVLRALGERYSGILAAQQLILDDPALVGETIQRIRAERVSARWALKQVVAEFTRRFDSLDDDYLRERGGELADVHQRLQRLLRGQGPREHLLPPGPLVIVAHALGPSDAVLLARQEVVALVTDVGGKTSHTAILAQALSLPAVVGLHDLSRRVREGQTLIVDGDRGSVLVEPAAGETERVAREAERRRVGELALASLADRPAVTRDGVEVTLRANVEFPHEVDRALRYGVQGIGLYRSEFLFLSHAPRLPDELAHFEIYAALAARFDPHPVVVRTLDLGGEKYFHEVLDRSEAHPVLGLRAVRFCLARPDIFRPQLRGLLRAAARHPNLRGMLPLVTTVEEVREVRRLIELEAASLTSTGLAARGDLPLGIMIEVPAAALAADLLAGEADFFSIGTNDLIQYALAVARGNQSLAHLYQPRHAGVLRLIRHVVDAGRERGLPVAMCGEMAADPEQAELLLGLGLRELSVQPRAVPAVRDVICRLDTRQAALLAARALAGRPVADALAPGHGAGEAPEPSPRAGGEG